MPPKLQAKLLRVIETRAGPARRQREDAPDRRALRRRDQPRPGGGDRGGAVPARPLLPPERHHAAHPAAARAAQRDPAAGAVVPRAVRARGWATGPRPTSRPRRRACSRPTRGRATCARCATSSSARCCCARAARSCPSTCRSRAWRPTRSRSRRRRAPAPSRRRRRRSRGGAASPAAARPDRAAGVVEEEKERILRVLAECGGNQTQAAKVLGIARSTLIARLETYGVPRPRKPAKRASSASAPTIRQVV